jgi:Putative tail fiber protein gp53-like, C-terminal
MATLIDIPEFTSNEVYEIQATDPVEGAASGASFSGIGLSNQPHQQLANRTALLKQRQDTNIGNISTLLAFMAGFAGSMQPNGYLKIPFADVGRGSILAVVQWGLVAPAGGLTDDASYTVTWPLGFPNACMWAAAMEAATADRSEAVMQTFSIGRTQGVFTSNFTLGADKGQFANTSFYWLAIGF